MSELLVLIRPNEQNAAGQNGGEAEGPTEDAGLNALRRHAHDNIELSFDEFVDNAVDQSAESEDEQRQSEECKCRVFPHGTPHCRTSPPSRQDRKGLSESHLSLMTF